VPPRPPGREERLHATSPDLRRARCGGCGAGQRLHLLPQARLLPAARGQLSAALLRPGAPGAVLPGPAGRCARARGERRALHSLSGTPLPARGPATSAGPLAGYVLSFRISVPAGTAVIPCRPHRAKRGRRRGFICRRPGTGHTSAGERRRRVTRPRRRPSPPSPHPAAARRPGASRRAGPAARGNGRALRLHHGVCVPLRSLVLPRLPVAERLRKRGVLMLVRRVCLTLALAAALLASGCLHHRLCCRRCWRASCCECCAPCCSCCPAAPCCGGGCCDAP
jgi:hypothetical protein